MRLRWIVVTAASEKRNLPRPTGTLPKYHRLSPKQHYTNYTRVSIRILYPGWVSFIFFLLQRSIYRNSTLISEIKYTPSASVKESVRSAVRLTGTPNNLSSGEDCKESEFRSMGTCVLRRSEASYTHPLVSQVGCSYLHSDFVPVCA